MLFNEDINGLSDEQIIEKYANYNGETVVALLKHDDNTFEIIKDDNLVVTTGVDYYAELIENGKNATGSPTNDFTTAILGNPGSNDTIAAADDFSDFGAGAVTGTEKVATSSAINNSDTDNTGKGAFVFTWKFEWAGSDFDTESANNVRTGIITVASASGTDPLLNHWNFSTPFEKLSTSALTLWVNHTLVGA